MRMRFLILLLTLTAYADDTSNCTNCSGVLDGLKQIEAQLQTDLNTPAGCIRFDGTKNSNACDFASMCEKLAPNAESADIFVNAKGEKVPNFALFAATQQIASCAAQTSSLSNVQDMTKAAEESVRQSNAVLAKSLNAQKAFYESMKKHHEEGAFLKLSEASVTLALKEAKDHPTKPISVASVSGMGLQSREDIKKTFDDQASAAKLRFSNETRNAYIEWQYQLSHGYLGYQPQSAPWTPENIDPFLEPQSFTNVKFAGSKDQLFKNQASLQIQLDRIYRIFKSTQQQILEYLDEQKTAENTAEIENAKKRIQTIRLDTNPSSILTGCPAPNAFYNPSDHQFHICPQVMESPTESLKMIIAHELTHSIDPCSLSSDLVRFEKSIIQSPYTLSQSDEDKAKQEKAMEETGYYALHIQDPQPKSDETYMVDLSYLMGQSAFSGSTPSSTVVSKGIPYFTHPFYATISCLQRADSIGARGPNEAEFATSLDQMIAKIRATGATEGTSQDLKKAIQARAHLHDLVSSHGGCAFLGGNSGNSQLQESFADKIAGEIVARDLAQKSPTEKQEGVYEASAFFLSLSCSNLAAKAKASLQEGETARKCQQSSDATGSEIQTIFNARAINNDEHPWGVDRINRLLLAHPSLRSDLGCQGPSQARYCP